MKITRVFLYEFSELSETAKERAITDRAFFMGKLVEAEEFARECAAKGFLFEESGELKNDKLEPASERINKYTLSVFPPDIQSYSSQTEYHEAIRQLTWLAFNVSLYNATQPDVMGVTQDFKNYIENKMPYKWILQAIGNKGAIDIQYADDYKRAGSVILTNE